MEKVEKKFESTLTIPCYDTDVNFTLKPASFMDIMQELAYLGANRLNFGYDELQKNNTAWVLARMHFTFDNPPKWKDQVKMETWHKGLDGLLFLRDFLMKTLSGDILLRCTSSWLVINTESRKLVRSLEMTGIVPDETQCHEDAIKTPCPKIMVPRTVELVKVKDHTVAYSDIDILGHANNARYMVWAMDCIDYNLLLRKQVKDVKINFNKETKPGQKVELYKAEMEDNLGLHCFVEGKVDGLCVFVTEIILQSS